jgi:hypothetical protein
VNRRGNRHQKVQGGDGREFPGHGGRRSEAAEASYPKTLLGILSKQPTLNRPGPSNVIRIVGLLRRLGVSFLKRLLGRDEPPKQRVRVCVECGMPVAEHKSWCSILRGQIEMQRRSDEYSQTS